MSNDLNGFDFDVPVVAAVVAAPKKKADFASHMCPGYNRPLTQFQSKSKGKALGCKSCNKSYAMKNGEATEKGADFANPSWWNPRGAKVSHGTLDSWLGKKDSRKLGSNKVIKREKNGDIHVRLHDTNVVTAHPNGDYTLNTGGWHTPTTKRTIAAITGLNPFNVKGVMHLGDGFPVEDGVQMTDYLAHVHDKTPEEGRREFFNSIPENLHGAVIGKVEKKNRPAPTSPGGDTLFDKTPKVPAKTETTDFSVGSSYTMPKYEGSFKLDKIVGDRAHLLHAKLGASTVSIENLKKMKRVEG